jgi:hypothetical protein
MKKMTIVTTAAIAIALSTFVAGGQPASQPPAPAPKEPYSLGFAEFMIFTQIRHSKLWLAGDVRNWELADYQVDELKEGLEDAAKHFPTYKETPVGKMIEALMTPPIADVEGAIKARDRAKFVTAFDKLTAACNSCHQAANRPFIVIQRPTTSPFTNQTFAPAPKR